MAKMFENIPPKKTLTTLTEALEQLEIIASDTEYTTHFKDGNKHRWLEREARALQVALLTGRPLLLISELGWGNPQLAKAINAELGWYLLHETVYSKMEPQDLIYHVDAIKRLSDAHSENGINNQQNEVNKYYDAGVLWEALSWETAIEARGNAINKTETTTKPAGFVISINEIDKADSNFPNALLEMLGERKLTLPCEPYNLSWPPEGNLAPLVLITSNKDRTLPAAFLRHCVVLDMDDENLTAEWLVNSSALDYYDLNIKHKINYLSNIKKQAWQNSLGKDQYGLFCDLNINNVTQRFRYIPPGTFLMGAPETDEQADEYEKPQHLETINNGFWFADTPCTQEFWQAVMGNNPSRFNEGPKTKHLPVEMVTFSDDQDSVEAFLERLKPLLPAEITPTLATEQEWEYACRANTTTTYWWGNEYDSKMANTDHLDQKIWDEGVCTTDVNLYPPNPWGLFDMHGNIDEWTSSFWKENLIDKNAEEDVEAIVVRGGTYLFHPREARAAHRDYRLFRNDLSLSLGFRLLLRPYRT